MYIRKKSCWQNPCQLNYKNWTKAIFCQGYILDTGSKNLLKQSPDSVSQCKRRHLLKPVLICHYSCEQFEAQNPLIYIYTLIILISIATTGTDTSWSYLDTRGLMQGYLSLSMGYISSLTLGLTGIVASLAVYCSLCLILKNSTY